MTPFIFYPPLLSTELIIYSVWSRKGDISILVKYDIIILVLHITALILTDYYTYVTSIATRPKCMHFGVFYTLRIIFSFGIVIKVIFCLGKHLGFSFILSMIIAYV